MCGHLPPHILPTCNGLPTPNLTPQAMPVQLSTLPLFSMLDGPLISFHSINLLNMYHALSFRHLHH